MTELNPFLLAAATPDPDPRLLPLLRSKPSLAATQDGHGYSLLHAAASYNHIDLLRALVGEFRVDVNLTDEDGETCLFVAETVDAAKCLVEELHIDLAVRNEEGMNAVEKFKSEQEYPDVAAYLHLYNTQKASNDTEGDVADHHPPPLPPNVKIDINTLSEPWVNGLDQEPDPEFKKRIEELAANENFHSEAGQRELRELITDAVRGVGQEERDVRRRMT